ncbi:MAG: acetate--CoA ligase family protein [Chromatiales bacterium]|jgi:cyanophycin synthetase|nr:acetate--CoA ligase family protein [Chromatiales bacterium]
MSSSIAARFLVGPNIVHGDSVLVFEGNAEFAGATLHPWPGWAGGDLPASLAGLGAAWHAASRAGTNLAAALIEVALRMQDGFSVRDLRFFQVVERPAGGIRLAMACEHPAVGLAAWSLAVDSAQWFARGEQTAATPVLLERCRQFAAVAGTASLDPFTRALLREVDRRGFPWTRLGVPQRFVQIGQGCHGRRLHATLTDLTAHFAARLTQDKAATNQLLRRLGFPQPAQRLVSSAADAVRAAELIGYPVVLKPTHGSKGRGVSVGLDNAEAVRRAFAAAAVGDSVVIESILAGDDHHLLVVGGHLVAASRHVLLARSGGTSRGSSTEDVTDRIHPDNARLAVDAARVVGLDIAGIDFVSVDISRSWREAGGGIIGINASPEPHPHWIGHAAGRDVAGPILDRLLPAGAPARVPTVGVTGSIGKTTTCRMIAAILAATGRTIALSTTRGTEINGRLLRDGDFAGGGSAINLLLDPAVEAGVFELARGGLLRGGMGIDRVDVGIVLNVLDNHLGLDGMETRADMAGVKGLVATHCSAMVVLNADDPLCLAMRAGATARPCLVSRDPGNAPVAELAARGGCTVLILGDGATARIVVADAGQLVGELPVVELPATLGGAAMGKAVNAAFALAAAHGLGIPFAVAAGALRGFESTIESSLGRQNRVDGYPFAVLLDWCDGPEASAELARVAAALPVTGRRRLLLSCVGNRRDAFVTATAAAVAGTFDVFYCTNHTDLRGRSPEAIPDLLRAGLLAAGVDSSRVYRIAGFDAALDTALAESEPGDLLAVMTYASAAALGRLADQKASPAASP